MSSKKSYVPPYAAADKSLNTNEQKHSILFWLLSLITIMVLVWAPFQKGLFNGGEVAFERPLYSAFVWTSALLLLTAIYAFYHWRLNAWSDILTIAAWLIPLTYFVSSLAPASKYGASNMFLIEFVYACFFLVGYLLTKKKLGLTLLVNGVVASGYVIVWFGIFNWFGQKEGIFQAVKWFAADMPNENVYHDAVMADASGVRLTSVFQYGNAYGAFLIALLLSALFLVSKSTKRATLLYHSFMLVPIFISFFLTLSRGALVILPIIYVLVLAVLKPARQAAYLIHTVLTGLFSFAILSQITNIGVEQVKQYQPELAAKGWAYLLITSVVYAAITLLIQKYVTPLMEKKLAKLNDSRLSNLYFPVGVIILGALGMFLLLGNTGFLNVLPENIKQRIENINFEQNSVLERGTFYKDALKLSSDYPVLGAGGGAWAALFQKYQNNPYVSRQAHNFFLQTLTEVGILGFAIFALFLIAVFYLFIRHTLKNQNEQTSNRFVFYIIALSLLLHSALDFDLSFVYLGILLFICLGAMISGERPSIPAFGKAQWTRFKWAYPALLLVAAVVFIFTSVRLLSANTEFTSASVQANSSGNYTDIMKSLNNALDKHPNQPDYARTKIDILLQGFDQTKDDKYYNEALALIHDTRKAEPHNRLLLEREMIALTTKNQNEEALTLANRELVNFPWDITLYERSITLSTSIGTQAWQAKDDAKKDQFWQVAFTRYNEIQEKTKQIAALPEAITSGRNFGITKNIGFSLGQINYLKGNYAAAEEMFKIGINEPLTEQGPRQIVRWYLASLQKQNKNDQTLFDKLIQADPKERASIQSLVDIKTK